MSFPLDTGTRTDAITDAIERLLADGGIERITLRAIAEHTGISTGTLLGHLTNRDRIINVCAATVARRRRDDLRERLAYESLGALLPAEEGEVRNTRCWIAWRELIRARTDRGARIAELDREEHFVIHRWLCDELAAEGVEPRGVEADRLDLAADLILAALFGVRERLVPPAGAPMSLDRARTVLATAASLVVGDLMGQSASRDRGEQTLAQQVSPPSTTSTWPVM